MRILVVTNLFPPEFLGGYELGCAQMVNALRQRGHDVRVVTSTSEYNDQTDCDQIARVLESPPIYSSAQMNSINSVLREYFHVISSAVNSANVRELAKIIDEYKPDVAYLWNLLGLGGLAILGLLKQLGIPWTWHIMDMVPRQLCGFGGEAIPQVTREFKTLATGTYIVCSTRVAEENRVCGIDLGSNVCVLPNWVTADGSNHRKNFFSGGNLRLMTAVGVIGEHKGIHILIKAAAKLLNLGYANFTIDIYGRENESRFRQMLFEQEAVGHVRFMGSREQPELLDLYSDYDAFVFPTWAREPFGFAPLEAAGSGCVPLFSADCGCAEWLVDGVHCLKADRNADAFAQRIIQILRGEIDLQAIGRRAQAVVCTDFHLDTVAPRVEAILQDAADNPPVPYGTVTKFQRLASFAEGLLPVLLEEARC